MKKTLSLILALLMGISCASGIFAEDVAISDETIEETTGEEAIVEEEVVTEEPTAYDKAIQFLTNYRIMQGKEDGLLHAADFVKRYEMAILVSRVSTGWVDSYLWENGPVNNSKFTDLEGTGAENSYGILSYADQKGIVEGYEDGTFKPEKTVTYREALTMAVRTLGYGKGLEYPWGFIEKAVGLGLTNGITGVAYTDEINRGVVAQIVYNTLFAETADGDTLAFDSFGVENGWQNIMVVADQRGIFSVDEERTEVGIAFRLVNANGTLGEDVYYAHNDLQVGRIYKALFVVDGEDNYVSNLTVEAYEATIVENKGTTDDEGKPYKTTNAIGAFLEQYDYTIVTEYTQLGNTILDSTKTVGDELIIAEVYGATTELVVDINNLTDKVVINWATGDILVKNANGQYDTVWHWSDRFGYYFRVVGNQTINGTINAPAGNTNIGIEVMDEDDMAALLALLVETSIKEGATLPSFQLADYTDIYGRHADTFGFYGSYALTEDGAYAPYAYLEAYDLDGDDKVEYAIFEEYRLGYMSNTTVYCSDCNADVAAIKLAAITAPFVGEPMYNGNSTYSPAYTYQITPCAHTPRVECAQFVEGYEPIMNANGKAVEGYVIYGVDRASNDIKVVKQITKQGDKNQVDEDSYVATGRVLGYSIYNKTINIEGKDISTSSALHQSVFTAGSNQIIWANTLTSYLATLYNQYITYVVVDGAIVYAEPCGAEAKEWIVVEGFRGINRDGKFVIRGYSTEDVVLDEFQIEVVDSNWTGDWIWNNTAAVQNIIRKGEILQITSYDAANDLYYVSMTETIPTEGTVTITEADGLFRVTNYEGTKKTQRMSENDKYIIIGQPVDGFKPVYVHEGLLGNDWSVSGEVISGYKSITSGTPSAVTVVLVNARITKGFDGETSGIGYLYVENSYFRLPEAAYDQGDYAGYSEYVVQGYDLVNPNNMATATCTNFVPTKGLIYKTVDGVILNNVGMSWSQFVADLKNYAGAPDLNSNKLYVVENFQLPGNAVPGDYNSASSVSAALKNLSAAIGKQVYNYTADAVDLLSGAEWGSYTLENGNLKSLNLISGLGSGVKYAECLLIYNLETGKANLWMDALNAKLVFEQGAAAIQDKYAKLNLNNGGYIEANATYTATKSGTIMSADLETISLTFAGASDYLSVADQNVKCFWDTFVLGGTDYATVVTVNGTPVTVTLSDRIDPNNVYYRTATFTPVDDLSYDTTAGGWDACDLNVYTIEFQPANGAAYKLCLTVYINAGGVNIGFGCPANPLFGTPLDAGMFNSTINGTAATNKE